MRPLRSPLARRLAVALAVSLSTAACEGESRPVQPLVPAAQGIEVRITPAAPRIHVGGTQDFTATVTGTSDPRVTWGAPDGGTIDVVTGRYVAPAVASTYHVRATSVADTRVYAEVPIAVIPPLSITVNPTSGAIDACRTLQLTATVSSYLTSAAVSWTVQEGAAGGSVSATGLYTAPSTGSTYHVVATSAEEAGKSVTVPVTVTERVLSVSVSPATVRVQPGQTVQFTSTVQTTCGSTSSVAAYTAP